jgi:glycine cleavage system H protein
MNHPGNLRYSKSHEWVRIEGERATIGITDFAQDELGDVVYLDLPAVGRRLVKGDPFGSIESVKAVSDLYAPLGGEVLEVNDALVDRPEIVNGDPYEKGWMVVVRLENSSDADELMSAEQYEGTLQGH